jgi:hypothetical protein
MRLLIEYSKGVYQASVMDAYGVLCTARAYARLDAIKKVKFKAVEEEYATDATVFEEVDLTDS